MLQRDPEPKTCREVSGCAIGPGQRQEWVMGTRLGALGRIVEAISSIRCLVINVQYVAGKLIPVSVQPGTPITVLLPCISSPLCTVELAR